MPLDLAGNLRLKDFATKDIGHCLRDLAKLSSTRKVDAERAEHKELAFEDSCLCLAAVPQACGSLQSPCEATPKGRVLQERVQAVLAYYCVLRLSAGLTDSDVHLGVFVHGINLCSVLSHRAADTGGAELARFIEYCSHKTLDVLPCRTGSGLPHKDH